MKREFKVGEKVSVYCSGERYCFGTITSINKGEECRVQIDKDRFVLAWSEQLRHVKPKRKVIFDGKVRWRRGGALCFLFPSGELPLMLLEDKTTRLKIYEPEKK